MTDESTLFLTLSDRYSENRTSWSCGDGSVNKELPAEHEEQSSDPQDPNVCEWEWWWHATQPGKAETGALQHTVRRVMSGVRVLLKEPELVNKIGEQWRMISEIYLRPPHAYIGTRPHVCPYTWKQAHTGTHPHTCAHTHEDMNTQASTHMCGHTHESIHKRQPCTCVPTYIKTSIHRHPSTHVCPNTWRHAHTGTYPHVWPHTWKHTHKASMHMCAHIHKNKYTQGTHSYVCPHTWKHAHTGNHTHVCAHTHENIHTQTKMEKH